MPVSVVCVYDGCVKLMLTASTDLTQGLPSSLLSLVAMASIYIKIYDKNVNARRI